MPQPYDSKFPIILPDGSEVEIGVSVNVIWNLQSLYVSIDTRALLERVENLAGVSLAGPATHLVVPSTPVEDQEEAAETVGALESASPMAATVAEVQAHLERLDEGYPDHAGE
jgi:hypothetical protein